MNLAFAVERRASTLAAVLVVAILGGIGLGRWDTGLLPYRQVPSLTVVARGPHRSQADLLQGVTAPLERRFRALAGVAAVVSETTDGICRFELHTARGTDIARLRLAARDVLDSLPDLGVGAVAIAVAAGETQPAIELAVVQSGGGSGQAERRVTGDGAADERATFVAQVLRPELAAIAGVGRIEVLGLEVPHAVVTPLAAALAARGLSAADLVSRLDAVGRSVQAGRAREGGNLRQLVVRETVSSLEQLGALRLATATGDAALGDVARIGARAIGNGTWFRADGTDGTLVRIFRAPGFDDAALSRRVHQRIALFAARLPAGLQLRWIADRGPRSWRSLGALSGALIAGLLLGIAPLRWLLGSWTQAAAGLVLLPVVLLLTSAALLLIERAPDLLALAALAAAAGLLLGDPLVVWATITGARYAGERDPARHAAERFAPSVATGALVAAVVLALTVGGGPLQTALGPAAEALAVALAAAAVLALTAVPALAAQRGSAAASPPENAPSPGSESGAQGSGRSLRGHGGVAYRRLLERTLRPSGLAPALGAAGLGLVMAAALLTSRGLARLAPASTVELDYSVAGGLEPAVAAARGRALDEAVRRAVAGLGAAVLSRSPSASRDAGAADPEVPAGAVNPAPLETSAHLENPATPETPETPESPESAETSGSGQSQAESGLNAWMGGRIELAFADAALARRARGRLRDSLRGDPDVSLAAPPPAAAPAALAALAALIDLDEPLQVYGAPAILAPGGNLRRDLAAACRPAAGSGLAATGARDAVGARGAGARGAMGAGGTVDAAGAGAAGAGGARAELRLSWRANALASAGDLLDLDAQVQDSLGDLDVGRVEIPGLASSIHIDPVTPRDLAALPLRVAFGAGARGGGGGSEPSLPESPGALPALSLPLAALSSVAVGLAPEPIWHLDGRPVLALRCADAAAAAVAGVLAERRSHAYVSGGAPRLDGQPASRLGLAAAAVFALILLGLTMLHNSTPAAAAIAGAAAAPVSCALAAVYGMPRALWVPAVLGLLVVTGVAVRPGLQLVGRAERLRGEGRGAHSAVLQAAQELYRPVLATAALEALALLPLIVLGGDAGQLSRPLALVVGWGSAGGVLAGLFLAPALYVMLRTGPPGP